MRFLFILFNLFWLFAFKFSPMSQAIYPHTGQNVSQFQVENDSEEAMGIEFSVKERKMDEKGKETLPATSDLTIFPPQVIIPPKEKRTIRVSWVSKEVPDQEKAFRVIAEQLPVKVDEKTKRRSGIQMLMRYMAALYVTPKDAEAKLAVEDFSFSKDHLLITINNSGNKHQVLTGPTVTFKKADQKWALGEKELQGLAGENVLPGSRRIFKVQTKKTIPEDAKASIRIDE